MSEPDPVYLALTRPATVAGVSMDYMAVNAVLAALALIVTQQVAWLGLCVPIHLVGVLACVRDPYQFSVLGVWLRCVLACPNRSFWGVNRYAPG